MTASIQRGKITKIVYALKAKIYIVLNGLTGVCHQFEQSLDIGWEEECKHYLTLFQSYSHYRLIKVRINILVAAIASAHDQSLLVKCPQLFFRALPWPSFPSSVECYHWFLRAQNCRQTPFNTLPTFEVTVLNKVSKPALYTVGASC